MTSKTKFMLYAILGGMVLSLLELVEIAKTGDQCNFPMFFLGMGASGVIGLVGYLIVAPVTNNRSALVAGIAAPQIVGGLTKTGDALFVSASLLFSPMMPNAYAQDAPETQPAVVDSVAVTIIAEPSEAKIRVITPSGKAYLLRETTVFRMPSGSRLEFVSSGYQTAIYDIPSATEVSGICLRVSAPQSEAAKSFLRGVFAQRSQGMVKNRIRVDQTECD